MPDPRILTLLYVTAVAATVGMIGKLAIQIGWHYRGVL
jgi:hypothetical protein